MARSPDRSTGFDRSDVGSPPKRTRWRWLETVAGVTALAAAGVTPTSLNAQKAAAPLVFDGVTVVDVETGKLLRDRRVVIAGNRIKAIEAVTGAAPKGAQVVDARGKYLIPGLWDMHVHTSKPAQVIPLLVANGVTGIREAFSFEPIDTVLEWRREILAGKLAGPPRQFISGAAIDETRGCSREDHGWHGHTCVEAGDTADARRLVEALKASGADIIKTYGLSANMYMTIAAAARRAKIPFGGHAPAVKASAASDSGMRLIDHTAANDELRQSCLYDDASVETCRPLAERFQRNGSWWVTTWIFPPRFAGRERSRELYHQYDEFVRDFWADTSATPKRLYDYLTSTPSEPPSEASVPFQLGPPRGGSTPDTAGYLYVVKQAGLPMVAGTDTYGKDIPAGFSLHTEIATFVAEGLTPLEALQSATLTPAKVFGVSDSLGSVAPGKLADLVLLDGDPLTDILNTTAIRGVVANGRYFDRAALDGLLVEARKAARAE